MKVVLLAGGAGTRISEETSVRPKPMIEIGGKPILWHIMKIYSQFGFHEFVICLGYKGYVIKEYFANYFLHTSDVTFDLARNKMTVHQNFSEPWVITLVETGPETMTGGRIRRVKEYVGNDTFMLTYGDGVSNINIAELVKFHRNHGKVATLSATQPSGKFGSIHITDNNIITSFQEKPKGDGGWINGGFFVLNPEIFSHIAGDETIFEKEPLEELAAEKQLVAFKHGGFWQPMDTLRDKMYLEALWSKDAAPWKTW